MEEELETSESVSVQTATIESVEESKSTLESLPSIEELRKSEQAVVAETEIQGVTEVEQKTQAKDRVFKRKTDEKKVYLKKRLKIVTVVYTTVVALLLAFVVTNIVTMSILDKSVTTNTKTIQSEQTQVILEEGKTPTGENIGEYPLEIELNEPRDYSEDKKDLTWLDKITILFRNIFG